MAMGRPLNEAKISAQWNPSRGICSVTGNNVSRSGGDVFPNSVGASIYIDGQPYTMTAYTDANNITVTPAPTAVGHVEWLEFSSGSSLALNFGVGKSGSIMDTYESKLKIATNGYVGIGTNLLTATPQAQLDVSAANDPMHVSRSPVLRNQFDNGTIYSITIASNVATFVITNNFELRGFAYPTLVSHGLAVGSTINIAGAAVYPSLNGNHTVTSVSSTGCGTGAVCKFTVATAGVPDATLACEIGGTCDIGIYYTSLQNFLYLDYDPTNNQGLVGAFAQSDGNSKNISIAPFAKLGIARGTLAPVISGTGSLHASGNTTRPFDGTRTPASSSESCNAGELFFDTTYLYVCISGSNIKRLTLTAF
jgi:hypothetical protein